MSTYRCRAVVRWRRTLSFQPKTPHAPTLEEITPKLFTVIHSTKTKKSGRYNSALAILAIVLTMAHIYIEWIGGPTVWGVVLLSTVVPMRFYYLTRISIYSNTTSLLVWLYTDIAFLLGPAISKLLSGEEYLLNANTMTAIRLGIVCLFVIGAITIPWLGAKREKANVQNTQHWLPLGAGVVNALVLSVGITAITASIVAYSFGAVGLGGFKNSLPLRLTGILHHFRLDAVPFLFIVLIDILYEKGKSKKIYILLAVYTLFTGLESWIRLSRGQILNNAFPILLWSIYRGIMRVSWLWYLVPIPALTVILYPYVTIYRRVGSIPENIPITISDTINSIIRRIFIRSTEDITQFVPYVSDSKFVQRIGKLIEHGGTVPYHTHVIDGIPESVPHGSGVTAYSDAYLIGGTPFTVVTALVIALLAIGIDKKWFRSVTATPAGRALLSYYVYTALVGGLWHQWIFEDIGVIMVWPTLYLFHHVLCNSRKYHRV